MEQRKPPCPLAWCDAAHNDDTPNRANHRKILLNTETVRMVARWAERTDGRPSAFPHITIREASRPDTYGLDLTPTEAVELSNLLSALWESGGILGFAAMLAAGAATLAPHEDHEHDDEDHYVADDAPERIEGGDL